VISSALYWALGGIYLLTKVECEVVSLNIDPRSSKSIPVRRKNLDGLVDMMRHTMQLDGAPTRAHTSLDKFQQLEIKGLVGHERPVCVDGELIAKWRCPHVVSHSPNQIYNQSGHWNLVQI